MNLILALIGVFVILFMFPLTEIYYVESENYYKTSMLAIILMIVRLFLIIIGVII